VELIDEKKISNLYFSSSIKESNFTCHINVHQTMR
jgi:hypothetical protein